MFHTIAVGVALSVCALPASGPDLSGANWYFGIYGGLTFVNGTPEPLSGGALATTEGCATISDASGNLLFYTDGITVYNREHQAMPNGTGLKGDSSASQSAIIVPHPGDSEQFFVFTVPVGDPTGLHYSIVDMRLDDGKGDILLLSKNIQLQESVTEHLASLPDDSGGYWVIVRPIMSTNFHAFHVTSEGVETVPVVSSVPSVSLYQDIGYLKGTAGGTRLGITNMIAANIALYDFDPATGLMTNEIMLTASICPYGLEFSPDGTKVYVSDVVDSTVYQYNLDDANPNSTKQLLGAGNVLLGAMQLAPDGRIYIAKYNAASLGVIHKPNLVGTACELDLVGVGIAGASLLGLPTFIPTFFSSEPAPPTVETAEVSALTTTGALAGGQVVSDGGAEVTERGVCWNTTGDPTTDDAKLTAGAGTGAFTVDLTGLTPGTMYVVRAYAINSKGTSYGQPTTFTTIADTDGDGVGDPDDGCPENPNLTAPGANGCSDPVDPEPEPEPEPQPEPQDEEPGTPSLRMSVQSDQGNPNVGDDMTFGVEISNDGNGSANGVSVTIPLPTNTEFVSAQIQPNSAARAADEVEVVNGNVVIHIGHIAPGQKVTVQLVLRALTAGPVLLTSTVSSDETESTVAFDEVVTSVADERVEIRSRTTVAPCGPVGAVPLAATGLALAMLPRRRRRR